jgi:ABC-2 type transport system permease protein
MTGMVLAIVRATLLQTLRDRGALLMGFVLPVAFFVIFAEIFSSAAGDQIRLDVAVVDEVRSDESTRLVAALLADPAVTAVAGATSREAARELVRRGTADVALVVRADGEALATASGLAAPPLLLLVDPARGMTATVLLGQLERAYFTALPDLAVGRVAELIGPEFTAYTPEQAAEIAAGLTRLRAAEPGGETGAAGWSFADLVESTPVAGRNAATNHVAYYAGAIAFMLLLFVAVQSAQSILDDRDRGTLDRIATGPAGIGTLVTGKFVFLTLQGLSQTTLVFVVAWLVYDVDLPGGFLAWLPVATTSAMAAAAIGLMLVVDCQTRVRAQVMPTVVILIMSALGGSMVPRFFMPDWAQQLGWGTPNTWALEAYSAVFWRGEALGAVLPYCGVLLGFALAALALTYWFARGLVRE